MKPVEGNESVLRKTMNGSALYTMGLIVPSSPTHSRVANHTGDPQVQIA